MQSIVALRDEKNLTQRRRAATKRKDFTAERTEAAEIKDSVISVISVISVVSVVKSFL